MANDYMDQWDINGTVYDIHDKGRGQPNGVAQLDGNGRVPYSQLPESAVEYKGGWDASTNTPTLAAGVGTNGDMYVCTVAGQRDIGEGTKYFLPNDRVVYNGTLQVWQKFSAGDVKSVGNVAPSPSTGNVPVDGAISNIFSSNFAAKNRVLVSDANGKVAESSISSSELGALSGISSNVQDQLDNKQGKIEGAASTVTDDNLTKNRVLVSDADGKIAASGIDATGVSTVPTNHAAADNTYGEGSEDNFGHCKAVRPFKTFEPLISGDLTGNFILPDEHNLHEVFLLQWHNMVGNTVGTYTFNIILGGTYNGWMKLNLVKGRYSYDGLTWTEFDIPPLDNTTIAQIERWKGRAVGVNPTWQIPIDMSSWEAVAPYTVRFVELTVIIEKPEVLYKYAFVPYIAPNNGQ